MVKKLYTIKQFLNYLWLSFQFPLWDTPEQYVNNELGNLKFFQFPLWDTH